MENMLIVDNALYSFGFQIENGVPIYPFTDDKADQELEELCEYLEKVDFAEDVRVFNSNQFMFKEMKEMIWLLLV